MFETVHREFGRLDIAVSNSGIEHFGDLSEVKGSDIDAVFAVNVKGQYFVAQQAYRFMEDYGRVMLTSSISAVKVREIGYMDFRSGGFLSVLCFVFVGLYLHMGTGTDNFPIRFFRASLVMLSMLPPKPLYRE